MLPADDRSVTGLEQQRSWMMEQIEVGDLPAVRASAFGERLRGARLYRGYLSPAQAALGMGIDQYAYRLAEQVAEVNDLKVIRLLAGRLGVTDAYLRKGVTSTVVDRNAEANVGRRDPSPSTWGLDDRRRIAAQLKTLRLARTFRITSSAALYFGWPIDLYSEIEGGRRNFTQEMVEMYADAYAAPVEYFFDNSIFFTASDWLLSRRRLDG